jgi:hypothetical protein
MEEMEDGSSVWNRTGRLVGQARPCHIEDNLPRERNLKKNQGQAEPHSEDNLSNYKDWKLYKKKLRL